MSIKKFESCPICNSSNVDVVSETETFEYKGECVKIPNYKMLKCYDCEQDFPFNESVEKSESKVRDLHKEKDGLLTSIQIKNIIKKFIPNLDVEEFSKIIGVDKDFLLRLINGKSTQDKTIDNLIRLLNYDYGNYVFLKKFNKES